MKPSKEMVEAGAEVFWGAAWEAYAQPQKNIRLRLVERMFQSAFSRMWKPIETAPKNTTLLGVADGEIRLIRWTKTSHVPLYGWCLVDQGAEDCDLCEPTHWMPTPALPGKAGSYSALVAARAAEKIQKVARAIAKIDWPTFEWDELEPDVRSDALAYGQAAVSALEDRDTTP